MSPKSDQQLSIPSSGSGPSESAVLAAGPGDGDPARPEREDPGRGRELVLERKSKTKKPRMFRVLLHNDDYTTQEFVVWVLQVVFRKSAADAAHLMLTIHHKGKGVAGVFTRDLAETKAHEAARLAEENQMPLQCTTEPDD